MGNTLAPMQKEFVDAYPSAREMLDRLEDMAQDRIDLFCDRICHDDSDKHIIPIDKVLNKHTFIGVTTEEKDGWIQDAKEAVKEFSAGPVADGLSSVATSTITKMLRSNAGKRQVTQSSAISIDWLGGISRLDYYIFTYTFSSTELAKRKASLIACCVVESSANIEGLDTNTLRVIVSRAFRGGNISRTTLAAIYAQLIKAIHDPVKGLSLTDQEKQALECWYNQFTPQFQTGFFPQGNFNNTGFYPQTGFNQGGFSRVGFSQSGFQPVGAEAEAEA